MMAEGSNIAEMLKNDLTSRYNVAEIWDDVGTFRIIFEMDKAKNAIRYIDVDVNVVAIVSSSNVEQRVTIKSQTFSHGDGICFDYYDPDPKTFDRMDEYIKEECLQEEGSPESLSHYKIRNESMRELLGNLKDEIDQEIINDLKALK